jgi:hypothetical protein
MTSAAPARVLVVAHRTAATPRLLDEAAGGHVEGAIGDSDPFAAVEQAVERSGFDEIIISTLPGRVSRWLHLDLPHRVQAFGLPVTVVTAEQSDRPASTHTEPDSMAPCVSSPNS